MINAQVEFIRSDDQRLVLGDGIFHILDMTGIGTLTPEIFTKKKAVDHGSIVTGYRIPEREFAIKAEIGDAKLNRQYLSIINSFFNPVYTYNVIITYLGDSKLAKNCYIRKFDDGAGKNIYKPIVPVITMMYPDAFFLSTDEFGKDIASVTAGFVWPYKHLVDEMWCFGVYAFGGRVKVYNDGDVTAYIKVKFAFTGECTDPSIKKGDSYVKVLGEFHQGDVLVIDAYDKSVRLNGQNVSTRVEKGSKWNDMILQLGDNEVSYDAEHGSINVNVYVYYNKRYLGIN